MTMTAMTINELDLVIGGNKVEMMELYLLAKEHDSDNFSKYSSIWQSKETDVVKYLKGHWNINADFKIEQDERAIYKQIDGGKQLTHMQVLNKLRKALGLM